MSTRFKFFIVVILAGILFCEADSGCPNEPVTPLPTPKPSPECPNAPVTPSPTEAPAQPVTTTTSITPHASGNENQPPSQPAGSLPINESNSVQWNSCPNRPGYLCVRPSDFLASQCCLQLCCPGCCSAGTEITTSTTSETPPEALIKCPPGTVLLGRRCHLLYCPLGSQMVNDGCIVTECPAGTVWSGHSCVVPEPIVQNLKFQSTIVTQVNQTRPQIVLNNTNNIFINASLSLQFDTEYKNDCNDESSDCNETTPDQSLNCCDVMTPRICKQYNNRWRCYSRRSRRCGEFCVAPIIYLRPSGIQATPKYLVMPPMQSDCLGYGNCAQVTGERDCSGCAFTDMDRCSSYCYRYMCPPRRCGYYDQEKYCADNVGLYGCQEEDGWFH